MAVDVASDLFESALAGSEARVRGVTASTLAGVEIGGYLVVGSAELGQEGRIGGVHGFPPLRYASLPANDAVTPAAEAELRGAQVFVELVLTNDTCGGVENLEVEWEVDGDSVILDTSFSATFCRDQEALDCADDELGDWGRVAAALISDPAALALCD